MNIRLVSYSLAGAWVIFGSVRFAASAEEIIKSFSKVESVLSSSEPIVTGIDVSVLSVQYREGKYIENARTRALRYAQLARNSMARASKEVTVTDMLMLMAALKGFYMQIETLIWQLDRPISLGDQSRTTASKWATALSGSADSLTNVIVSFEDEVGWWAQNVDKRLAICP